MELNNVKLNGDEIVQTKVCKCCGEELPITEFRKNPKGEGFGNTCKKCVSNHIITSKDKNKIKTDNERLKDITSRELITELRFRGYKGKLEYTQVINV